MLVKSLHRLSHLIDISRGIAEASHVLILTDTIRIEQAGPDTLTDPRTQKRMTVNLQHDIAVS